MTLRILCLLVMVGCSVEPVAAPATAPEPSVSQWVQAWLEVRRCLVVPAEDVETGAALSLLAGRNCAEALQRLEHSVPVGMDPLIDDWRRAISRLRRIEDFSAATRAGEVHGIDTGALVLATRYGYVLPPIPKGTSLPIVWSSSPSTTVRTDWLRGWPAFVLRDGPDVISIRVPRDRPHYSVDTSDDGGRTWRTNEYRGWVRSGSRNPATNAIELLVSAGSIELHTFALRKPPRAETLAPGSAYAICHRGSETWFVSQDHLHLSDGSGDHDLGSASAASISCTEDAAVVDDSSVVTRCNQRGCRREFSSPVPNLDGHAGLLEDGRWIFAVNLEHVAAVWVEGIPNPFYLRLGESVNWPAVFDGRRLLDGDRIPASLKELRFRQRN